MDFDDITFPDDYDPFAPAPINNTTGGSNTDATTNQSGHDSTRDNEVKSKRIQKVKLDENL
jgi:hypothetical protein